MTLLALALLACGTPESAPQTTADLAAEKCPRIGMDRLGGDYIVATGQPERRFRITSSGSDVLMWLTDPTVSNHRLELVGTMLERDWRFDERPRGARAKLVTDGGEQPKRVYVQPHPAQCSLGVTAGVVGADGKEAMPPKATEFLQFPDRDDVAFSFRPFDEPAVIGAAAKDPGTARAALADDPWTTPVAEMGDVTVAVFVDAATMADGCTFTFDAFFDGQRVAEAVPVPVPDPKGSTVRWSHTFAAPYSGNHRFEIKRFQTCSGERELLAMAGVDAVLQ